MIRLFDLSRSVVTSNQGAHVLLHTHDRYNGGVAYTFLLSPELVTPMSKKCLAASGKEIKKDMKEGWSFASMMTFAFGAPGFLVGWGDVGFMTFGGGLLGVSAVCLGVATYPKGRAKMRTRALKQLVQRDKVVRLRLSYGDGITNSHALKALLGLEVGDKLIQLLTDEGQKVAIGSAKEMKRLLKGKLPPSDLLLASILPIVEEYLVKTAPADVVLERTAEDPDANHGESEKLISQLASIYAKRIEREFENHQTRKTAAANYELEIANEQLRSIIEVEQITDGELSA